VTSRSLHISLRGNVCVCVGKKKERKSNGQLDSLGFHVRRETEDVKKGRRRDWKEVGVKMGRYYCKVCFWGWKGRKRWVGTRERYIFCYEKRQSLVRGSLMVEFVWLALFLPAVDRVNTICWCTWLQFLDYIPSRDIFLFVYKWHRVSVHDMSACGSAPQLHKAEPCIQGVPNCLLLFTALFSPLLQLPHILSHSSLHRLDHHHQRCAIYP